MHLGDVIDMIGSRFELVARLGPDETDTALFRTRMATGKLVPLHSHADLECFYVLAGRIEVFLMDDTPQWHGVETGCSLLAANGIKHAIRNTGEQSADLMLASTNRFAAFLEQAGRAVSPDTPFVPPSHADIQRMLSASEAFGYWNAPPAESVAIIGASP